MHAAILKSLGATPQLGEFREPEAANGVQIGRLVAAALNPVDLIITLGKMPHRQIAPDFVAPDFVAPDFVAGYEGIVALPSGELAYVGGPPAPFGSLADLIPVPVEIAFPVPESGSPELAATLVSPASRLGSPSSTEGTSGLTNPSSSWAAAASVTPASRRQAAKAMRAGTIVVADVRASAPARAASQGADATINLANADEARIDAMLSEAAPHGFDLIVDLVWGAVVNQAIDHANMSARLVQVGSASGPIAPLVANVFRNKHMSIIGSSVFAAPVDVRRDFYARLMDSAAAGAFDLDLESNPLDAIEDTWARLKAGTPYKLIVRP